MNLDDFPEAAPNGQSSGDGLTACADSVGKFDAGARKRLQAELEALGPEKGNNRTGRACWLIFIDYGRSVEDGLPLLKAWNARRHEPHDEKELQRKMKDALDHKAEAPRGTKTVGLKVKKSAAPSGIHLVRMSEVTPEEIRWLWYGRVSFGSVTLFDGDPGLGKSTTIVDLAARVTTGRPMPGELARTEPSTVVILTAEDALASVLRPRLDAAGADSSRVVVLQAVFDDDGEKQMPCLPQNFAALEQAIEETGATFVAIDPLVAYLSESVNSHKDAEIRKLVMAPLARLAERTGAAIVALRHLRKMGGTAINRGGGTIGFTAAARSVLIFGRDPEDEDACLIASSKSNLGRRPPTLRYKIIGPDDGAGHVEWLGESDATADDLAGGVKPAATKTDACEEWLADFLANGRREYAEVKVAAEARGFDMTGKPMITARKRLRVEHKAEGRGNKLVWWWLPAKGGES